MKATEEYGAIYMENDFKAAIQEKIKNLSNECQDTIGRVVIKSLYEHCFVTVKFVVSIKTAKTIIAAGIECITNAQCIPIHNSDDELMFIIPDGIKYKSNEWNGWASRMKECEKTYHEVKAQKNKEGYDAVIAEREADKTLPENTAIELLMTASLPEWKIFFRYHNVLPELLNDFMELVPGVFDNLSDGTKTEE